MTEFVCIPEHPEYSVNVRGEVRSERSGVILSHDMRGRVKLRSGGKRPTFYVGELLSMVGLVGASPDSAQTGEEQGLRDHAEALEKNLGLARRANGHLLCLVEKLRKDAEARQIGAKKRIKPRAIPQDARLDPLDFA